ncbi:glycosyltransferase family 4 protein [Algiphilus sp. NNCM1]|uniref:glycosyltransferase family 4 protein n=1 Tax=Algiphilus sp. TaxID=1872431 RepID=UPI001CA64E27|nr:glycosyltransferase family 4 protein [Algiphilus sp.]MBY8965056.1 glycosyltransferase family 4 protein [Algiphilus acroporae]MCI5104209.1 glycosyltransferase family 4 protein [Algiphilus sp.]
MTTLSSDSASNAPVLVVGAYAPSLINFRGDLLRALAVRCAVVAASEPADAAVLHCLQADGIAHQAYPVARNSTNPLADLQTLKGLRRLIATVRPAVVLAYTVKPIIWGGLALRLQPRSMRRVRFVALVTGLGYSFESRAGWRRYLQALVVGLYRLSLRRADAVVFQNRDNRDEFIRRRLVPRERAHVVAGSGIDVQRFAFSPISTPESGRLRFLLIARLLGEKGIREYAEAARKVRTRFPDSQFDLIGPLDPSPDGLSAYEVGSWPDVNYLGSMDDVRPAICACHVYVLPSYHEGMPRTVLEAMAIGRPILTTDVSGCRETVEPGRNGWLVGKANADDLAERMIWFIENPDCLPDMGKVSRQLAEDRFDVHKVNADMLRIMCIADGEQRVAEC